MNDKTDKVSLGATVLEPIIKGYQVGGMALALMLVGTILLLTAVASDPGIVSYTCASVGAIIILSILLRIYFIDYKKVKTFKDNIKESEELLDSIQDTAIQMTELSSHLQSLAFKHADKVGPIVTNVKDTVKMVAEHPLTDRFPIAKRVADLAEHEKIKDTEQLSYDIVKYTESAKEVIENIRIALIQLNPEPIKKYREKIEILDDTVKGLLVKST